MFYRVLTLLLILNSSIAFAVSRELDRAAQTVVQQLTPVYLLEDGKTVYNTFFDSKQRV